jgi:hypothetical protein
MWLATPTGRVKRDMKLSWVWFVGICYHGSLGSPVHDSQLIAMVYLMLFSSYNYDAELEEVWFGLLVSVIMGH